MGRGVQGDPSAAMLEVLDPEQNATSRDNYLGVPFDLSRVVFIATANMLDTIPVPCATAWRSSPWLATPRTRSFRSPGATWFGASWRRTGQGRAGRDQRRGLAPDHPGLHPRSRRPEPGARDRPGLRHAAVRIAEGSAEHVRIDAGDLAAILGPVRFEDEVAMRTSVPGVATGLAWTPVGGDILFIEASRAPGKGGLILTGQLGDVMRESAQAAMTLVKSRAASFGIDPALFEKSDIHIHVPAGATPKDGPSAGVAMFTALVSLLTGRTVRSDTAMTGEISLRGLVLPVGGIKEKVTAAARAGLTRVMLPARNRRDFEDIPEDTRARLEFIWLERVDEAIASALEDKPTDVPDAAE